MSKAERSRGCSVWITAACALVSMGVQSRATAEAAPVVATTLFARGAVTASAGGNVRLLGNRMLVHRNDVLSTGRRSFVILRFNDGTKMTLRPKTVFRVDEYREKPGSESMLFRLFRGGLRAVTGLLSKRRPGSLRIRTALATIGIRGTDFAARLCGEGDCAGNGAVVGGGAGESGGGGGSPRPGLWATVFDEGQMTLSRPGSGGGELKLTRGQAALAGAGALNRLPAGPPRFLLQDGYFQLNTVPDTDIERGQFREPEKPSLGCKVGG